MNWNGKTWKFDDLVALYERSNRAYHSGDSESDLSDREFDSLKDLLEKNMGKDHPLIVKVGAKVDALEKAKLPRPLGSLNKVRPGNGELESWLKKLEDKPVIIMAKVDGSSLLLHYVNGLLVNALTRGDGEEGKVVLHHVVHIPGIPKFIDTSHKELFIRGELLLKDKVFKEKFRVKYKNPRNMVAGALNRKVPKEEELREFTFLAYHVFDSEHAKSVQLANLNCYGFFIVQFDLADSPGRLSDEKLTAMFQHWRDHSEYGMDGLVLEVNSPELQKKLGFETNSLNPVWSRAFKTVELEDKKETEVQEVEWNVSKDGYLKPRIRVSPIELSGVTVTHATGFNGNFIDEHKIGPGAKIIITRSGDVIPYVLEVTKPAKGPYLPDEGVVGSYEWNVSGVDLVLTQESREQNIQKLVYFFKTLEVDFFSDGWVERFYDAGLNSVESILCASEKEMIREVDGVKEAMAKKFRAAFDDATSNVYLPLLMKASGCFGRNFGETKSEMLYDEFKDAILGLARTCTEKALANSIIRIKGFSEEGAWQAAQGLKAFVAWLDELIIWAKEARRRALIFTLGSWESFQPEVKMDKFNGSQFVFTGFRNAELEERIVALGGKIGSGVSKNTSYLVVKSKTSGSSKMQKAKDLGVKIIDCDDLLKMLE